LLFDHSADLRGLVIGTTNKSELLLGFGILFGDLASAVNLLGGVYETTVLQLSKQIGIPAEIIDPHPSAVLYPGKSESEETIFDYSRVDPVLHMLVDERYSLEDLLDEGRDMEFLSDVIAEIRGSQCKRSQPNIPKLTGRTAGHDFRYLRDWGT
jgi:NAD+ synthase